jgi:cytochrome b involved in lipid metabolism
VQQPKEVEKFDFFVARCKLTRGSRAVSETKVYALAEVAKHNKSGDAWVAIRGKVYDGK